LRFPAGGRITCVPPEARRIVCSAPARANLIGNPSDQYGGCTLGVSLRLRAWAALDAAAPGRIDGDAPEIARATLAHLGIEEPAFGVRLATEIPRQSGVAGSTALVVALLRALLAWQGHTPGPHALAELARSVEYESLGVQCGFVDQYLCTFGGLRHVDLRGKHAEREDAPVATVEDLSAFVSELPFVLAFSGVRHSSDSVHRPIRARWLAGERAVVEGYARVAEIGILGKTALLRRDWPTLGRLMNENHAIQRDLGGSGPADDALIEAALAAGAVGAKLAGAGGGGTIVALALERDSARLEAALRAAGATRLERPAVAPGVRLEPADAILPPDGGPP
jgi:galactokinase/mevalonate kinase-like predicted kinase